MFADLYAARIVARCLNSAELLQDARTLCWVLMPDHLHWLVQLGERGSLSALVQRLKAVTARQLNLRRGRAGGTLWAPAFHDHALRTDENLESVARYIVGNPLRAGLVDSVGLYPHWDAAWDWEW